MRHSVHLFDLVLVASGSLLAIEECLAVLVETEAGHNAVTGVNGDLGLLSVCLFLYELLNVDAPPTTVYFNDFALTVLVWSSDDLHSIAVANGDGASLVFGRELFVELSGHHSSAKGGWRGEMGLARLSTLV